VTLTAHQHNVSMVELKEIEAALAARRDYVKEHLETLTAKTLRQLLAVDMGLPSRKALDSHKADVRKMLDKVCASFLDAVLF
jgi:hypothetical protein